MKKTLIVLVMSVFLVLGIVSPGIFAASDTGLSNSPAFEEQEGHHGAVYRHNENDTLRFNTNNGHRHVPGQSGENADENSVVSLCGCDDTTMVKPGSNK